MGRPRTTWRRMAQKEMGEELGSGRVGKRLVKLQTNGLSGKDSLKLSVPLRPR